MKALKPLLVAAAVGAVALLAPRLRMVPAGAAEGAPDPAASAALHVEGMTCPSCKVAVRTALKRLDGVQDARVDVAAKSATVDYDATKVTPQQLVDAVNRLGYQASLAVKRAAPLSP